MLKLWPKSMLGRNLAVLIPMVALCQSASFAIWIFLVQYPRIDDGAALVSSQIHMLDQLLASFPEPERAGKLHDMGAVPTRDLDDAVLHARLPAGLMLRAFLQRLQEKLPEQAQLRWGLESTRGLWVRLRPSDELWLPIPANGAEGHGLQNVFIILLIATAIPTLGAYWLHRSLEAPLGNLARAAAAIETGNWPAPVPVQGPQELAMVTEAFNRMATTLSESDAVRAEMLAGISHDLRTPLTKLRMVIAEPALFENAVGRAERFIEDIDAILGQFIDFARNTDTELAVPGDINALISRLAADYAGLGHPFVLDLQALPPIGFRPVSMQRLLMNLMQNAVHYGRTGLAVRTARDGGFVLVSVEDSGPGIPQENLAHIKRPFYRGSRVVAKGAGLGLSIAERIARVHGGSLELWPIPAGGLAAQLRLPLPHADRA